MNVFVLTGAGVSAESGLATFRGKDGMWRRHSPFDLATPQAFKRDPDLVLSFYDARRRALLAALPNDAHRALARLETELSSRGITLFLCTQNVDDLHERAGSQEVTHMHGELRKARCTACDQTLAWDGDMPRGAACPRCGASGSLRPHVVWFEEMPLHMERIDAMLDRADLFVAIGTSGTVHPASRFVEQARAAGASTVEINLQPYGRGAAFDERRIGPATRAVPAWVGEVLAKLDSAGNL